MVKSAKTYVAQALREISILNYIDAIDKDDSANIIRMLDHFEHRKHQFLVFELLSFSLYDLLKNHRLYSSAVFDRFF